VNGRRVVVVDDNPSMRMLVGMHLRLEGWDVVGEAADAEEGLSQVRALQPDAVVLDQELPLGPGTRVLPAMREHCPQARIVLFSADATNQVLSEELGADGFLLKGEPLSELTGLLGPQ
jgi:DNA-binding NarL/FixJ family response regulator